MSLYLDLLKKCLLNTIYKDDSTFIHNEVIPYDEAKRLDGRDWPLLAHTMVGMKRLENVEDLLRKCVLNCIAGDFLEAGVWRGGTSILAAGFIKEQFEYDNINDNYFPCRRKVYVCDSFEGLPPPASDNDKDCFLHTIKFLSVPLKEVKANFKSYDLLGNVVFIPGFFKDTMPFLAKKEDLKLCVLRLDGDMYDSTWDVLTNLYDKVSNGGYIIIDDYNLPNCKRAVDDFRKSKNINIPLVEVDWTGVYWRKE